jgi:TRAP-type mannitol/chloroaromatic compound transport system substrate-binding protein
MTKDSGNGTPTSAETSAGRRGFLKGGAAAAVGAPAIVASTSLVNAQAKMTLRMQSSWQPGTTGYSLFETWAKEMVELSDGEVAIKPFPAGAVSGDFQLMDAVRNNVLDGMNVFTVYWAGRMAAGVFLSSYPMGPNHPHMWDMLFDSYGGREMADELYKGFGLKFVGHVHHDMNLIHSKKPITSLEGLKGLKLRVPGGIVADCFADIGAQTTLLPGSDVYPALEKGTIDAADFVGPAVNYDLGFHQVTDYITMGPTSTPCLHQPVDLMDVSLSRRAWNQLSDRMKKLFPELVDAYSRRHYAGIQEANKNAWPKYEEAGVEVTRLSEEDVTKFRDVAIPNWFKWANKDKSAARLFQKHLQVMQNPEVALIEKSDIKKYSLDL